MKVYITTQIYLFSSESKKCKLPLFVENQMELQKEMKHTKVVLCGSSSVGKTTILQRILNKNIHMIPNETMGVGFASVVYKLNNTDVPLNIWDTAGQEAFRSLVSIYFKNAEIVVLTFDITSRKSFDDIHDWIDEVNANCGDEDPVFVLCGNKQDKSNEREVSPTEIAEFASIFDIPYFEVSAFTNSGIEELMNYIAEEATGLKSAVHKTEGPQAASLKEASSDERKKCC